MRQLHQPTNTTAELCAGGGFVREEANQRRARRAFPTAEQIRWPTGFAPHAETLYKYRDGTTTLVPYRPHCNNQSPGKAKHRQQYAEEPNIEHCDPAAHFETVHAPAHGVFLHFSDTHRQHTSTSRPIPTTACKSQVCTPRSLRLPFSWRPSWRPPQRGALPTSLG